MSIPPSFHRKAHRSDGLSRRRAALLGLLLLGTALPARAQQDPALHVAVLETRSFVAVGGSERGAAGLFRYREDTLWTHLGWANTRGSAVTAAPADPQTVFLACGNGVLRTRDGGATWRVTTDWHVTEVMDVAVDPNAPQHVYIATAYGVWFSPDGGQTWEERNRGLPAPQATYTPALAVDRRQAGRLVVATAEGLFRSTDGAERWRAVGPRHVDVREVEQSRADPDLWLAGTGGRGMLLSRDGGETWASVGEETVTGALYAVAADPKDPDRLAAGGYRTGVYLSIDGGRTWRRAGLEGRTVHTLAFDPNDPSRLWAGTVYGGVYRSDDAGAHWTYSGLRGTFVSDISFFPTPAP